MQEQCQHSSVPAEPPLCRSASGFWRMHTEQDRETVQGYPMSPPWQCHLWLTTVFWLNWSFCTASIREACGLHKPCASPCVGLSGGELCHWHREFILRAFPHLKLESQPFHCSLWFSWTHDISIELKSLLLPVHYAAAQAWPFWLPHLGNCNNHQQYLEVTSHDSCFCPTHASFAHFPLKISTFILKWW